MFEYAERQCTADKHENGTVIPGCPSETSGFAAPRRSQDGGGQDTRLHFVFYPYFCGVSGGGMGKLMGALSYSW